MDHHKNPSVIFFFLFFLVFVVACSNNTSSPEKENIVTNPDKIDVKTAENIEAALRSALANGGKINDTIQLQLTSLVNAFYKSNDFSNVWSKKEKWAPLADSLFQFIQHAELSGLFPKDYHAKNLQSLKSQLDGDSLKRMNATLWATADLMFTDGLIHVLKDLKVGRLQTDSLSLNADTTIVENVYVDAVKKIFSTGNFSAVLNSFEPQHKGYIALKQGIKRFLDSMDRRTYTYVTYPYKSKDTKDSLAFIKTFQRRLNESNCIDFVNKLPDSLQLNAAVKKYQKLKGLKQDGVISSSLIRLMNSSDAEKFKRIAITLDRYKQLPAKMPEKYIWVNLPGYYLEVWDHDTLALESKVICGKPSTRTPLLNSHITDMITYPTWTVPNSIIVKQYLPKLKNNPNYLSRLGLHLVNSKGETVSGSSVNWAKYSKGIPYKVMQGSGDDNALGVFKFNFENEFAVYLHDTNQRYLFKNSSRAFSHGCVRVQEWEKLAYYIARNDSMSRKPGDTLRYNTDSIKTWLAAKQRKRMDVKNGVDLFIRYFTCEGNNGVIKFYDDIYGEDKALREKYFNDK
ncbi:L,D-transpeptidase family protein [Ferruginibacter sp. SUN002]|uniref:L,D-transpeptidase family protein n=1 Tax=Ferruginibacter sp. SUN002 TaxID=2937789 RepID=UPI003D36ED09